MDWSGLTFSEEKFQKVTHLDQAQWLTELNSHKEFFLKLDQLPLDFLNKQEATLMKFISI